MAQSTSVVFSLQELARMEEERVRRLGEAAEQARMAREHEARDAEERARLREEERRHAEAQARSEVERRAREEAAKIDAIHRAAVEAARVEAQARVALDAREAERRHELEREHLRLVSTGTGGGIRGVIVAATFGALLSAGAALALYLGSVAPRERARADEARSEMATREVALDGLRHELEDLQARANALDGDLATARAESERLRSDLDRVRRAPGAHPAPSHVNAPAREESHGLDGFTACPPGSKDPLCLH